MGIIARRPVEIPVAEGTAHGRAKLEPVAKETHVRCVPRTRQPSVRKPRKTLQASGRMR